MITQFLCTVRHFTHIDLHKYVDSLFRTSVSISLYKT